MARTREKDRERGRNSSGARPVADCLQEFFDRSGVGFMMQHPHLHAAWCEIVGDLIARQARIVAFRGGTVDVAVDSSTLMHEIQFHRAALLQDLREKVRKPFISNIRFKVVPKWEEDERKEK